MEEAGVEETKKQKYGTKDDVWKGLALRTRGGLVIDDLALNARGKPCSKKSQERGRQLQAQIREKKITIVDPKLT